jgi:uncharacterized integral membrane protein
MRHVRLVSAGVVVAESRSHTNRPARGEKRTAVQLRQIAGVVAIVVGVLFVLLNTQEVTIHWVFFTSRAPLIVALLVAAAFGAIGAYAFSRIRSRRARHRD